jgi:hypothetical protein
MDKNELIGILQASKSYSEWIEWARQETVSDQWGMGIGDPWSLEPYVMETLGIKPGRMLKGKSEPAKHRYHYFLDSQHRMIHEISFGQNFGTPDQPRWGCSDMFYRYGERDAIAYLFPRVINGRSSSPVEVIHWFEMDGDRVLSVTSLNHKLSPQGYSTRTFTYENDKVVGIRCSWPE